MLSVNIKKRSNVIFNFMLGAENIKLKITLLRYKYLQQ